MSARTIARALFALALFASHVDAARCTGSPHCRACKTCSSCAYCAKGAGTCGVCSRGAVAVTKADTSKKAFDWSAWICPGVAGTFFGCVGVMMGIEKFKEWRKRRVPNKVPVATENLVEAPTRRKQHAKQAKT